MTTRASRAYASAGVDLDSVGAMLAIRGIPPGNFASDLELPAGLKFCISIESIGTKAVHLAAADRYEDIGWDAAAMAINDLAARGARALFLLDHVMTTRDSIEETGRVIAGIREAAGASGAKLIGGETAQLPGILVEDCAYASVVAIGGSPELIRSGRGIPGDKVFGIPSSGPHASGFALLGEIEPFPEPALARTTIYRPEEFSGANSAAHVTGGGLLGKCSTLVGTGATVRLDAARWRRPAVFSRIGAELEMDEAELAEIFNMGIGMLFAAPPDFAAKSANEAIEVGEVVASNGGPAAEIVW